LAIPVADRAGANKLGQLVDQLEILALVEQLQSVGMWDGTFNQLEDQEVLDLLAAGTPETPN
jgi:predicted phosphoribosyltransferase